jgi:hypothetical protein
MGYVPAAAGYLLPHAAQTWCGRFFSPHFLQRDAGITGSAS